MFTSISTAGIVFSFLGFRQGVELAGESDNPRRNVPFALIGSVLITTVIYVLLQVAFIGAAPTSGLHNGWANLAFANDFGPLAGIAKIIGLSWLASILYADGVISPADTGLIYTTATARISYAMGRNGNARASSRAPRAAARRAGAWVLPWLASLAVISYLGSYGDSSAKLFGLGPGAAITFGMSAIVYLLAYTLRLPRERVEALLAASAGNS